jgi:hypothetical protein
MTYSLFRAAVVFLGHIPTPLIWLAVHPVTSCNCRLSGGGQCEGGSAGARGRAGLSCGGEREGDL